MKPLIRLGPLLTLCVLGSCSVDQRPLTFEYHALETAGSLSNEQSNAAGYGAGGTSSSVSGSAGAPSESDAGECSNCGGLGDAGTTSEVAGKGGKTGTGGGASSTGGSNAGATGSAGTGAGGAMAGAANAGGAGQAGSTPQFPCGDLNQDNVDDCQQTLVQNSRFDANANNWELEPSTTQTWDAKDASGKPGSGSLQVGNVLPAVQANGTVLTGTRQCIPVAPTSTYDFAARVLLAPDQATGQGGVNVWLFDDDACQGNLVTGATPISGGVAGSWTALKGKLWIPGGVHSMYVRLVAIKPFPQPTLSVFIDDVLVAKR